MLHPLVLIIKDGVKRFQYFSGSRNSHHVS